jgi:hypothetical protein
MLSCPGALLICSAHALQGSWLQVLFALIEVASLIMMLRCVKIEIFKVKN